MPLYNAREYLEETVQSVLDQEHSDWELLIVDDRSTDGSYELAAALAEKDGRIRLFRMPANSGGPAAPRNFGVSKAQGEYVAFLDADDRWYPQKLRRQLQFLAETGKKFTSCNAGWIDGDSHPIDSFFVRLRKWRKARKPQSTLRDLLQNNFIVTSSVLVRKELLSPFREEKELIAVEDLCLWLEIFRRHPGEYLFQNEELLDYRILETSISQRGAAEKQNTKMLICIGRFLLENDLTHLLGQVKWSLCKNQLTKLLKLAQTHEKS
ncbi:glycosyltransferase family 2 protein [Hydrogenimonas sp.]